ncbi:DUF4260 domain-containing protein [Flavobacterium subsaxonicum]|uniref:DUF4260 domain-containing protein n=1 Tax=Flavobacterium subsaxonicum WB 4.1-42 = DSM 21790 TaxID=1121898 RepID=A0A0A2MH08_9FLAO|nr:DUF4260 domain-containing protein [Flavobacterium subsaxonicum]KGO90896.1 hypothetical protein Q766_20910 [Flavobacterium subsaxonicum WB 4.1-42 = DSM 21790]
MKTLIQLEEAAMLSLGIYLFSLLPFAWWWFPALILVPDFAMLGYAFGAKAGAWAYNLAHHKGVAIALYIAGVYAGQPTLQLVGVILFAHSSMDRLFGYGLKYEKGFKFTHLGEIGK